MKKILFLFFAVLMMSTYSFSQITVTAGSVTANPGDSVVVPITVTNFSSVGAITLKLQYTTSSLTWGRALNFDSQLTGALAGNASGVVTIAWDAVNGMSLASGKLVDLKFLYTGGNATLTFTAASEIADINGNVLTVSYTGGSVKPAVSSMSGSYYIGAAGTGPNGTNPNFSTLKSAADSLNKATIGGNITFYITSNLTEAANTGIGVNPDPYTVTFKPYTGTNDTITFAQTTDNSGVSGGFALGSADLMNSAMPLKTTKNIILDGSNTANGTTQNLVIRTLAATNKNTYPIRIFGDVQNVTIKNVKVVVGPTATSYAISITTRNASSVDYVPKNITINGCDINSTSNLTSGQGIGFGYSGTITSYPTGIVISNNTITATTRGIFLYYAGNTDIFGNQITINQTNSGYISSYIYAYIIGNGTTATNVINIYNNKLTSISSANAAASNGVYGIWVNTSGVFNIYNNFIAGFNPTTTTANPSFVLQGIRVDNAAATANIVNNSIYIPNFTFTRGTGSLSVAGIYINNGVDSVINNIIFSDKAGDTSYAFYRAGTAGTLYSNNNLLYASDANVGFVGNWNGTPAKALADWKTASSLDAKSISNNPGFKSATDLHLASSATAPMGKGVLISWNPKDIDGDVRDNPPEIGADEIPGTTPVELTSFTASSSKNAVVLNWSTATETNNASFVVERKTNNTWEQISSVAGKGTTTQKQNYTFTDNKVNTSKAYYRLKQVDFNGSYTYSNVVEVSVSAPASFELSQNYPNPFNPSTVIRYSVPVDSKVKIDVYSVTGQLVTTLFDGFKSAGNYEVTMKADNLSSGVYIYRMTAGSTVLSKKMQLLK